MHRYRECSFQKSTSISIVEYLLNVSTQSPPGKAVKYNMIQELIIIK